MGKMSWKKQNIVRFLKAEFFVVVSGNIHIWVIYHVCMNFWNILKIREM